MSEDSEAEEFDRSRGYHLTRAERADRAERLAEGAPVVQHVRDDAAGEEYTEPTVEGQGPRTS